MLYLVMDCLTTSSMVLLEPPNGLDMLQKCELSEHDLGLEEIQHNTPSISPPAPSHNLCSSTPLTSKQHSSSLLENELLAPHRLGMEEGFEKSPMAHLIEEYSSAMIGSQLGLTEMSIMWVLSLEELTLDLIKVFTLPRLIHMESMESLLAEASANLLFHGHHGFHVE